MKKFLTFLIWLILLAGLVYYLFLHSKELKSLLRISVIDIVLLVGLFIATQLINGFRAILLLRKVSIRLKLIEAFCLANLNTMVNYLPFKPGMVAAAFYLKKNHSLSYTRFVNIVIASHLVQFLTVTLSATIFILFHYFGTGIFLAKLFYIFFILTAVLAGIILLIGQIIKKAVGRLRGWKRLKKVVDGFHVVLGDKRLLARLLFVNFLGTIVMGLRLAVCFKILSFSAPIILSFLTGQVKIIATLLSIVPSGLGIAELFSGAVTEMMNSGINIGIFAASVDRMVSVLVLVLLGSASFIYLYNNRRFLSAKK